MYPSKLWVIAVSRVLFLCIALSGQSAQVGTHLRTFRVEGTVRTSFMNSTVEGIEVKFEGDNITKTVHSDGTGFYRAELPVGVYKMTASWGAEEKYRRPLFRVASPAHITLNVTLYPDPGSCDTVIVTITHQDGTTVRTPGTTADDSRDICGGQDYLPIASKNGVRFDLFVRYSNRRRSAGENTYSGGFQRPVFAAYNLLTLEADKLVYNAKDQTIKASGDVVIADGSDKTRHADSAAFKLEDGRATPLNKIVP